MDAIALSGFAHIFFAESDTTSDGEKEESVEARRDCSMAADLSCSFAPLITAWHNAYLDGKYSKDDKSQNVIKQFEVK